MELPSWIIKILICLMSIQHVKCFFSLRGIRFELFALIRWKFVCMKCDMKRKLFSFFAKIELILSVNNFALP